MTQLSLFARICRRCLGHQIEAGVRIIPDGPPSSRGLHGPARAQLPPKPGPRKCGGAEVVELAARRTRRAA